MHSLSNMSFETRQSFDISILAKLEAEWRENDPDLLREIDELSAGWMAEDARAWELSSTAASREKTLPSAFSEKQVGADSETNVSTVPSSAPPTHAGFTFPRGAKTFSHSGRYDAFSADNDSFIGSSLTADRSVLGHLPKVKWQRPQTAGGRLGGVDGWLDVVSEHAGKAAKPARDKRIPIKRHHPYARTRTSVSSVRSTGVNTVTSGLRDCKCCDAAFGSIADSSFVGNDLFQWLVQEIDELKYHQNVDHYEGLKLNDLKDLCIDMGVSEYGKKKVLFHRLANWDTKAHRSKHQSLRDAQDQYLVLRKEEIQEDYYFTDRKTLESIIDRRQLLRSKKRGKKGMVEKLTKLDLETTKVNLELRRSAHEVQEAEQTAYWGRQRWTKQYEELG